MIAAIMCYSMSICHICFLNASKELIIFTDFSILDQINGPVYFRLCFPHVIVAIKSRYSEIRFLKLYLLVFVLNNSDISGATDLFFTLYSYVPNPAIT